MWVILGVIIIAAAIWTLEALRMVFAAVVSCRASDIPKKLESVGIAVNAICDLSIRQEAEQCLMHAQKWYSCGLRCLPGKETDISSASASFASSDFSDSRFWLERAADLASASAGTVVSASQPRFPAGKQLYSTLRLAFCKTLLVGVLLSFLTTLVCCCRGLIPVEYEICLGTFSLGPLMAVYLFGEYITEGADIRKLSLLLVSLKRNGLLQHSSQIEAYYRSFERLYKAHLQHAETDQLWSWTKCIYDEICQLSDADLELAGIKDAARRRENGMSLVLLLSRREVAALNEKYGDADLFEELFAGTMVIELAAWVKDVVRQKHACSLPRMNRIVTDYLVSFDGNARRLMPSTLLLYPESVRQTVWRQLQHDGYDVQVHPNSVTGGTVTVSKI